MKSIADKYIRVGTSLFKRVKKPMMSGKDEEMMISWNLDTIKQDYPTWRDVVKGMERYNGFCTIPEHLDYKRNYQGFYNLYEPIALSPSAGDCPNILNFVRHIFGDQYEIGLDYLQLLFIKPSQRLPVLCLVSSEGNTGKTTFLNLLKMIYGNNMTFNTNADFRSNFNSDWVSKLIIAIDEVLLDRKEDSEKIKNLSTAKSYKAEAKGKDRFEVEFFGKIILCSNNEDNFMVIGVQETRYWVRKVPTLKKLDPDFLYKLEDELPHFLHFLLHRQLSSSKSSRMWFTPEQIYTPALRRVKSYSVNKVELELFETIKEIMESRELTEFCLTNTHAKKLLERSGLNVSRSHVRKILEEVWQLKQYPNASNFTAYQYDSSGSIYERDEKGRYYKISQQELDQIFSKMLTN
ncbi:primase-helicase family protein [Algoriphagus aquimarinus]|uniref:primase-helicase family protein n=1 Tax=Algoriphagus aquimarinus TaxID=237018 RepID=UPI0030DD6A3F